MKATASSTAPKKKALKSAFYNPAGGFFSQKKKVVLGNVKHSGNEKDIFLSKFESSDSIYSDVESLSGEDKDVNMSGTNGESLLGSAITTPKANMEMATSLARKKGIDVNSNLKKQGMSVPISCSAAFGGKSWAQVVLLTGSFNGLHFAFGSGSLFSGTSVLATLIAAKEDLVVDMDMDNSGLVLSSLFSASPSILTLDLSSSKVLTTKIGCLESKLVALKTFIGSVLAKLELIGTGSTNRFDGVRIFSTDLDKGFLDAGVAIIMDNNLACHVCKIEEIPDWVILVWLLFKDKLSVSILGLYASALAGARFSQVLKINAFIAKAVNSSTFLVISGNFNENVSRRSACFRFCSDLGLVNLLSRSFLVKALTWSNFRGVEKTIDFVFVNTSLASAVVRHAISSVLEFFESDYKAVLVSVGLSGLVDVNLNGLHKQANKNK
ncbi:hypothetical protein G9A89_019898 [Geosiphon pyriformis]|nr:hypothetical protein G9A89_019898 [Geosiphon pyriformis]